MILVGAIICAAFCCIDSEMLLKHLPSCCSFRYEDAVSKYEAVMKTEPNVQHFTVLAKERICHALAQVRQVAPAMRSINTLLVTIKQYNIAMCFPCVVTRVSRQAELSQCAVRSSSQTQKMSMY